MRYDKARSDGRSAAPAARNLKCLATCHHRPSRCERLFDDRGALTGDLECRTTWIWNLDVAASIPVEEPLAAEVPGREAHIVAEHGCDGGRQPNERPDEVPARSRRASVRSI